MKWSRKSWASLYPHMIALWICLGQKLVLCQNRFQNLYNNFFIERTFSISISMQPVHSLSSKSIHLTYSKIVNILLEILLLDLVTSDINKNSVYTMLDFSLKHLDTGSTLQLIWTWIIFYLNSLFLREFPTQTIIKTTMRSLMNSTLSSFELHRGKNIFHTMMCIFMAISPEYGCEEKKWHWEVLLT